MALPAWQTILQRAQETVAVWQPHAPVPKGRTLTLALHQADTAALPMAAQFGEMRQETRG